MTDYNLYGCDYLDASAAHFRSPIPQYDYTSDSLHLWHSKSIPTDSVTDDLALPRVSHCSIEVDICVQDITNRKMVKERQLHHDFVERSHPLSVGIRLVYSMAGLWKDETKRRKRQMSDAHLGSPPFPSDALVSMSADLRDSQPQGWIHEEEYRREVEELIIAETGSLSGETLTFDTITRPMDFESSVKTALQSVEDLYPSNLMPVLGLPSGSSEALDPSSSVEVDENSVQQAQPGDNDFFPDDSDEEAAREVQKSHRADVDDPEAEKDLSAPLEAVKTTRLHPSDSPVETPVWESLAGICQSGLATGKPPKLPLFQALPDAAEVDGFVGRTPKSQIEANTHINSLKRRASGQCETNIPWKQAKTGHVAQHEDISRALTSTQMFASVANASNESPETSYGSTKKDTALGVEIISDHIVNLTNLQSRNDQAEYISKSQDFLSQEMKKLKQTRHISFDTETNDTPGQAQYSGGGAPSPSGSNTLSQVQRTTAKYSDQPVFIFDQIAPSFVSSANTQDFSNVIYQEAYYSKEQDVPARMREYAGREFRLESNTLPYLPDFDATCTSKAVHGYKAASTLERSSAEQLHTRDQRRCSWRSWEIAKPPPSYHDLEAWWELEQRHLDIAQRRESRISTNVRKCFSQIDGPTPKNPHGFKYTQRGRSTSVRHEVQYMSTMSLEIHVNTRGKLVPNPEEDEVQCIFWALKSDEASLSSQNSPEDIASGIIVLCVEGTLTRQMLKATSAEVAEETSELDLMTRMVEVVRTYDPDVLTGYEVHGSSWGYLIERARHKYDYNLCDEFSRMKTESHGRFGKENDRWGFNTTSTIRVTGRHMINIWRAMRGELNLLQYTMENVVWHLLHRRIPHYPWQALTRWYKSGKSHDLVKLLRYYQTRTKLNIEILEANELIPRTSEQARLLGVDFFSVFSRGSQFKVESIMFRIAKPENFILVSPNRKQVGGQNALECLPLVMEPQSAFYSSPVLVLDFQSLYPSVMIAYNYCYSTFLGRITHWRGMNKMGFTEYERQQGLLALLKDHITIAPNGMMYVKSDIRKSLLAKMLTEILETRVMVKSGMKREKDDKTLQQLLNNRQLALKLLANVTYGYTSASFSGRMPCAEIADSIVQTARETLERSIAFIHSVKKWGGDVVYGDTDSLFIHLKGKTKDQAFDIGNEIAKTITNMNPRPVKLKFEKVYHPCVLLAKKRYVGYKYESKDQAKPDFDAKGIETVRRDGTPAEQKIEEKALRLLFETADLSQIKAYFQKQCDKIMRGNVSVQDFCFAREVRLGSYSGKGVPPAGAMISTKRMLEDARAEPQYGERVPYVVITGAPGARLIDRSVAPEELLSNPQWRLDAEYYISKNLIPPLERIFNLVGANVRQWYAEMPKVRRVHQSGHLGGKRTTLESYMKSTNCLICGRKFTSNESNPLCPACTSAVPSSIYRLQAKVTSEERKYQEVLSMCQTCAGLSPLEDAACDSKDCPVFWTRVKQSRKVRSVRMTTEPVIRGLLEGINKQALEW